VAVAVEIVAYLVSDQTVEVLKRAIQFCTCLYPVVFKRICQIPGDANMWGKITTLKVQIFNLLANANEGVRVNVVRYLFVLILVQSAGNPALGPNDLSLSLVPPQHPYLISKDLHLEGAQLFNKMRELIGSTAVSASVMMAIITLMLPLLRRRPQYIEDVLSTLMNWSRTPPGHLTPTQRRSVERTIKIVLSAILRLPSSVPYGEAIAKMLGQMGMRHGDLSGRRRDAALGAATAATAAVAAASTSGAAVKRPAPSSSGDDIEREPNAKRSRAEVDPTPVPTASAPSGNLIGADLSSIPPEIMIKLILKVVGDAKQEQWDAGITRFRQHFNLPDAPEVQPVVVSRDPRRRDPRVPAQAATQAGAQAAALQVTPPLAVATPAAPIPTPEASEAPTPALPEPSAAPTELVEEAAAPLTAMDLDSEAYMPASLEKEDLEAAVQRIFSLESSFSVSPAAVPSSAGVGTVGAPPATGSVAAARTGWMLILARLAADEAAVDPAAEQPSEERVAGAREMLLSFVLEDFRGRSELAILWLHREFEVDQQRQRKALALGLPAPQLSYPTWFHRILDGLKGSSGATGLDPKDRTFTKFLIDVPEVTDVAIDRIVRAYCDDPERPAVRDACLNLLFEYCLHTCFFGDFDAVGPKVEQLSLKTLNRLLEAPPPPPPKPEPTMADETMADAEEGAPKAERTYGIAIVASPKAVAGGDGGVKPVAQEEIDAMSWREDDVVRHLELFFALCSKKHDLLLELFKVYPSFHTSVQKATCSQIYPLINTMASTPARLHGIVRSFPEGSEDLLLRVLSILTEKSPPSPALVAAVRSVIEPRGLDARFLVPVISGMEKSEALIYLPKMVMLLDGTEQQRDIIREAFLRLVDCPSPRNAAAAATGTGVASGVGGGGGGPSLSPAELLIELHRIEDDGISLQKAMQVFKQEVLAVVLQQLVDQKKLPTIFMRTVIQSVNQFKTLANFVNSLLMKLVVKKIWTAPKLWDGFVRCCTWGA
ncbi:hypothetical protein BDK51DRAFT_28493, partial [Blyttiomyces helicus]